MKNCQANFHRHTNLKILLPHHKPPLTYKLKCGVLFVGAGPASLAGSIRLMQLLETAPEIKAQLGDFPVAIVEKGKYVGAHCSLVPSLTRLRFASSCPT